MDTRYQEIREGKTSAYAKHSNPREIENDIRGTRNKMDALIDIVSERLHPRHLLEEALHEIEKPENRKAMMGQARNLGRKTVSSMKMNPWPAVLMGAGAAWMAYQQKGSSSRGQEPMAPYRGRKTFMEGPDENLYDEEYDLYYGSTESGGSPDWKAGGRIEEMKSKAGGAVESAREKAGEKAEEAKEKVSGKAQEFREKAGEKLHEYRDKSAQSGRHYREKASEFGHRAGQKTRQGLKQSGRKASRTLHNHPLALGAAALAAGVVLGLAIPESSKEDELLGDKADRLKDRARQKGSETLEKGKHVAQATATEAMEEVKRQGLTPGDLKEQAKGATESPESAKQETDKLADKAKTVSEKAVEAAQQETRNQSSPAEERRENPAF